MAVIPMAPAPARALAKTAVMMQVTANRMKSPVQVLAKMVVIPMAPAPVQALALTAAMMWAIAFNHQAVPRISQKTVPGSTAADASSIIL